MSEQEDVTIPLPSRQGIRLHTIIRAQDAANTRPVLVLLHFWGGSNRTFSSLISHLQGGYNLIAPSMRGWGQSSKPIDRSAYHITDYANDIADLVSYLQAHRPGLVSAGIVLVGHSMGGKISQVLLTKPELEDVVKGLVLIAPAPVRGFQLATAEMRQQQIHAYDQQESARFVIENVLLGRTGSVDANELDVIVADAVGGSEGARSAWPEYGMAEDFEDAVLHSVRNVHGAKGLRVLVIGGSEDRIETPSSIREGTVEMMRDAGLHVEYREAAGSGHLIPIESPTFIAESIATAFS